VRSERRPAARPGRVLVALAAAAASGLACDSPASGAPAAVVWTGRPGAAEIAIVAADGVELGTAALAPALDGPPLALAVGADGRVVVLQDAPEGAPHGVVLDRAGARVGALASLDSNGDPVFAAPPWAAAVLPDGEIWVTGGLAPARVGPDGAFRGFAPALSLPTHGIAALPDGRVVVTWGANRAAVYPPGGGAPVALEPALGPPSVYHGLDALLALPDGTLLVGARRWTDVTSGLVVHARVDGSALEPVSDPALAATIPGQLPSALARLGDDVLAAPALAGVQACIVRLSADLRASKGCLAPGPHRGVAVVGR
jgi:hypothetical protein